MASDYNILTRSLLLEMTEDEWEALAKEVQETGTNSRNIVRRALKVYFGNRIPDHLFTDRKKGNLKSKSDPQPEAENQLGAA